MSKESKPGITVQQKEKDPRRVAAGKKLGAISKMAKERKGAKLAAEQQEPIDDMSVNRKYEYKCELMKKHDELKNPIAKERGKLGGLTAAENRRKLKRERDMYESMYENALDEIEELEEEETVPRP